ncbi:uncharacterized protein LOC143451531 [Clavelina lepadiformis]|uniref:Secreted protein n=1 Tax=Clavelina lepadiformis TaxID=159417 RepID=A0ABP0GYR5_CLALP
MWSACIGFTLLTFLSLQASALDCYQYSANSYDGIPEDADLSKTECPNNTTQCATISWTSELTDADTVKFKQGICADHNTCKFFCAAVYENLDQKTSQCQIQCCNQEGCNKPTKHKQDI